MPRSDWQIVFTYVEYVLKFLLFLLLQSRTFHLFPLAWKLEGGQGEFRSKINTAASHPLRTFRKRYLIWHFVPTAACPAPRLWPAVPHSLSHWPIQKWLLQNFRKARKRPSFCSVYLVAAFLQWQPCSLLVLPSQFLSYSLFSSFLWIVVGKIKYLENSF